MEKEEYEKIIDGLRTYIKEGKKREDIACNEIAKKRSEVNRLKEVCDSLAKSERDMRRKLGLKEAESNDLDLKINQIQSEFNKYKEFYNSTIEKYNSLNDRFYKLLSIKIDLDDKIVTHNSRWIVKLLGLKIK